MTGSLTFALETGRLRRMKKWLLFSLVAGLVMIGSGCVKYRVKLDNGSSFTVMGKPKLDKEKGVYTYKAGGEEASISSSRVISIAPAGWKE